MIVYRVQNSFGRGPYQAKLIEPELQIVNDYLFKRHNRENYVNQPAPWEDDLWDVTTEHLYGFKDLKQLSNWFAPVDLVYMATYGFRVFSADVSERTVMFGKKQLAFIPTSETVYVPVLTR